MPMQPNIDITPVRWPISRLRPHPRQTALFHDLSDPELAALAADIEANGQRTPVEVVPSGSIMTIISGHQRVRALRSLGQKYVWVVVRADLAGDEAAAEKQLIGHNLIRRQLDPLGRARCIGRLMELERGRRPGQLDGRERGQLRDRIARLFGLSGRTVSRYLSVLTLPGPLQDGFSAGQVSLADAARLFKLSPETQQQVAEAIAQGGDVKALLDQHPGERGSTRSAGSPRGGITAVVAGLRRWLAAAPGEVGTTNALSRADRRTLNDARALIEQLLTGSAG
jgi:ParB family chromosome partitioning protein